MQISQDSSSRHLRKFRQTDLGMAPMIVLDLRGSAKHWPTSYGLCISPPGSPCSIRKAMTVLMGPGWAQELCFQGVPSVTRRGLLGPRSRSLQSPV